MTEIWISIFIIDICIIFLTLQVKGNQNQSSKLIKILEERLEEHLKKKDNNHE